MVVYLCVMESYSSRKWQIVPVGVCSSLPNCHFPKYRCTELLLCSACTFTDIMQSSKAHCCILKRFTSLTILILVKKVNKDILTRYLHGILVQLDYILIKQFLIKCKYLTKVINHTTNKHIVSKSVVVSTVNCWVHHRHNVAIECVQLMLQNYVIYLFISHVRWQASADSYYNVVWFLEKLGNFLLKLTK